MTDKGLTNNLDLNPSIEIIQYIQIISLDLTFLLPCPRTLEYADCISCKRVKASPKEVSLIWH